MFNYLILFCKKIFLLGIKDMETYQKTYRQDTDKIRNEKRQNKNNFTSKVTNNSHNAQTKKSINNLDKAENKIRQYFIEKYSRPFISLKGGN